MLGPLPSNEVLAWTGYARQVLGEARRHEADWGMLLADDQLDTFIGFLDQWEKVARRRPRFRWSTHLDPEVGEYLLHGFHRIVERLAKVSEARGQALAPPECEPFYTALVTALLDGLESEGPIGAEFSDHLRSFWPGLPPD